MKLIRSSEGMYYEGWLFFHHKTKKSILVSKSEDGDTFWLPISQCINDPIPVLNQDDVLEIEICIPEWLAIKNELI